MSSCFVKHYRTSKPDQAKVRRFYVFRQGGCGRGAQRPPADLVSRRLSIFFNFCTGMWTCIYLIWILNLLVLLVYRYSEPHYFVLGTPPCCTRSPHCCTRCPTCVYSTPHYRWTQFPREPRLTRVFIIQQLTAQMYSTPHVYVPQAVLSAALKTI